MILRSDARHIPLADDSVQCVVTSPPFWGLRKYSGEQEQVWGGRAGCGHEWSSQIVTRISGSGGDRPPDNKWKSGPLVDAPANTGTCQLCGAWRGGYGLEPTIELYVQHTVEIFREVRRVLRPDGVCFLNLGDSYAGSWGNQGRKPERGTQRAINGPMMQVVDDDRYPSTGSNTGAIRDAGLKPKDLCLIPFRVALALQADGWWVRSDIIWSKGNPMPESVTDRPTDAYEHIFMLTKSARYYWDAEAVKEEAVYAAGETREGGDRKSLLSGSRTTAGLHDKTWNGSGKRNLRNVWEFSTQPFKGAHFATFPEELVIRSLQAATSEKGCCASCGAPWERIVEQYDTGKRQKMADGWDTGDGAHGTIHRNGRERGESGKPVMANRTKGWRPTCSCCVPEIKQASGVEVPLHAVKAPVPCLVLDPFSGSGTVGLVAFSMGRRFVLCDLAYQDLQRQRIPPMAFVDSILR